MDIDRRALFRGAGMAAAAVAAGLSVAGRATTATATLVDGVGAATKAQYPYVWWLSRDGGEEFIETFASKEEALAALAMEGDGCDAVIAECQQQDFDLRVSDDDLFEAMQSSNEEAIGEGEFIEWTPEQGAELEREVNAVIKAWAARHKINRHAWQFADTRNHIRATDLPAAKITADAAA